MEIGTDMHTNNPLDLARSRVPVPLATSIDWNERDAPWHHETAETRQRRGSRHQVQICYRPRATVAICLCRAELSS